MNTPWRFAALAVLAIGWTTPAWADPPPLIPRTILFGNPEKANPQISPDGKYLAYVAPDKKNVLQVWVRTVGQKDDRVLTADKKRGIRTFFWAHDGEHLMYHQDTDGDENDHILSVSLKTKQVRDLTPFQGVKAWQTHVDAKHPGEMLVALNLKDRGKFDVYRVNLKSGAVEFDTANPGNVTAWVADPQLRIRAAWAATPDGGFDVLVRDDPGAAWKKVRHAGPDDHVSPLHFTADGKALYLSSNLGNDTERLTRLDLAADKETVLAEDPHVDFSGVLVHPTKHHVQAVSFNADKITWKVLDPSIKEDFAVLPKLHKGQYAVTSRDNADKTWLVSYTTDDGPVYYYLYDRATKKGELLFSHQPKLEGLPLAAMRPISYKTRDGLTVHGYLTTPVGVKAEKLPTVLLVHGGPWGRDAWGYNGMVQCLANRGYAVLQVNFRGSAGYGKKFLNAGNREWAGKMHNDLLDGVDWLIAKGVADPKKVAILGGSYGGYATLVGLTFTPEKFACGVDIVGPSNLVTLLNAIPPYWAPLRAMFAKRVGDPEKDKAFLESRSPLFFADRIKVPLLIGQGANDPRVKQAESDQIVSALRKAGKPVEYIIYSDEGHGFARPENRLHFFAHAEAFLARHLGGRSEPVGEIQGHSGRVVNGRN
jgi:dipeptidyl aminopeptidase/acylaminoacyl peptidase